MKVSASRPPARETISGGHHSVPSFYKTAAVLAPVLPSRCARCGAVSRDFLCAACLDFLVADRPMWLNPGLLPGPSLLDLTGGNEVAIVGADLSEVEGQRPPRDPAPPEALRLVLLRGMDPDRSAIVSVGDAEVLHAFLREARRNTPRNVEERRALAALCRYLRSQEWMPPHLAAEYGLRAKVLEPPTAVEPPEPARREMRALPPIEPSLLEVSAEPDIADVPAEPALDELEDLELPEDDVSLPTAPLVPPEPVPRPEPPLPLPQPGPGPARGPAVLGGNPSHVCGPGGRRCDGVPGHYLADRRGREGPHPMQRGDRRAREGDSTRTRTRRTRR